MFYQLYLGGVSGHYSTVSLTKECTPMARSDPEKPLVTKAPVQPQNVQNLAMTYPTVVSSWTPYMVRTLTGMATDV